MEKLLGVGTFAKVYEVRDLYNNKTFALKISKKYGAGHRTGVNEISVLEKLSKLDPNHEQLCVKMLGWSNYREHVCVFFNILGPSVRDYIEVRARDPIQPCFVRRMAYQLCHATNFLHRNNLTHTDIKPRNILFANSDCEDIRLIDLGSAKFDNEDHEAIVTTRPYRAPEVILELGWRQPCDVWSVGCCLFYMLWGLALFEKTENNSYHLAMMETLFGPFPAMLRGSTRTKYFRYDNLDLPLAAKLQKYKNSRSGLINNNGDDDQYALLNTLIRLMLEVEPLRRITLEEALRHDYFRELDWRERLGKNSLF